MSTSPTVGLRIEEFTSIDNRRGCCASAATMLTPELSERSLGKPFIVRHWSTISHILSLVIVFAIWCLLLKAFAREVQATCIYMVFVTLFVTVTESLFIWHKLLFNRGLKENRTQKLLDLLSQLNTWKKLSVYVLLSVPAFYQPKIAPLTLSCGVLINLIGIIHFFHFFREKNVKKPIRYQQLGIY
nr:uncharacterized protein LOC124819237 [Hydra vulgaris]